jgi:hypothetical protein
MVHISIIEAQLSKLGFRASRWFRPEIKELQHILMDEEELVGCVQGRYFGGFASGWTLLLISIQSTNSIALAVGSISIILES